MAACQIQFVKKTGGGEHGVDAADEDNRFWHYVHHDMLLMFMWLHWGRGKDVPSHCSALLEGDHSFDTGLKSLLPPVSSPSRTNRKSGAIVQDELLSQATRTVQSVHESILSLMSPPSPCVNAAVAEAENKAKITAAITARIRDVQVVLGIATAGTSKQQLNAKIDALVLQLLAVE
jgi:hypothetical protein